MEFEVRKEVLEYMKLWGERIRKDLDEGELAFVRCMEESLLIDKVYEVEKRTDLGSKYYQEMENFYNNYIEREIDFSNKSREEIGKFYTELYNEYKGLVGGNGVGF